MIQLLSLNVYIFILIIIFLTDFFLVNFFNNLIVVLKCLF